MKITKSKKGNTMTIEQKLNIQELTEQDYTNVYGGTFTSCFIMQSYEFILPVGPEDPIPPGIGLDSLHQQPPHTGIFGG